ncbi:ankyrin repeat domain-containing protein [Kitasatospora sp. NPDC057198]|uniref:ankyrin repeat domain-containing protein n=1 Tax=Kitasatospora sp. NPDC057198 TaxID=3346046 RepID=UPI0036382F5E
MTGWDGIAWAGWSDHAAVLARLEAGADPERYGTGRPLHLAAAYGSPQVVAELAARVVDVDARENGTTALWRAVLADRPDNARALAAAGADPWRPQLGGWSPGRLALAGPVPDLFPPPAEPGALTELTPAERETVRAGRELVAALGTFHHEGTGLACVAGIDADEAVRRLGGEPLDADYLEDFLDDPYAYEMEEVLLIAGATTVPGGCVVTQPWGYTPSTPGALARLTAGTFGYGLYANPKSGNQGSTARDGTLEAGGLHPGGDPRAGDTPAQVLDAYLYRHGAVAAACAFAGLRPADDRAVSGPADRWFKLPGIDWWAH